MDGFVTLAVGDRYLQMAAAFALSARRFGYETVVMAGDVDPGKYRSLFAGTFDLTGRPTANPPGVYAARELKRYAYEASAPFTVCCFVDADSLVIRNPGPMFAELARTEQIHTPAGCRVRADQAWAAPAGIPTQQAAQAMGVPEDRVVQTLNGGFLFWKRGTASERWFDDYGSLYGRLRQYFQDTLHRQCTVSDELCAGIAFAQSGIELWKSNSSIGVWDAAQLKLDIAREEFTCVKHHYWEGHQFGPYIAHFGGSTIGSRYRECAAFVRQGQDIDLPLFNPPGLSSVKRPQTASTNGASYDFSHWPALPRVSCQCITYGRTSLLDEAVESFLRQDYPGWKELVILNDLPSLTLRLDHPEVRVVNLTSRMRSIGEKRNACMALCEGDVIFPWDDDDISLPHRISYSLQQMTNHRYFKADRMWTWRAGGVHPEPKEALAHAMGCWSKALFDEVGGYPHIQSGQDAALEKLFEGRGRTVEVISPERLYFLYRYVETASYHLSAFGYGRGFEEVAQYVERRGIRGTYEIKPAWAYDYAALVAEALARLVATPAST